MKHQKKRTKNKKRKSIIIFLLIIIASLIAVAVFFLAGQYFQEKKDYEAQTNQESQAFTENLITELDQVDTSEEGVLSEDTLSGTKTTTKVPEEIITEVEKKVIGEELAKLNDKKKQKALQALSVAYSKALNQQKLQAFTMVDKLIDQAKVDWAEIGNDNSDESALARGKILTEYLAKSKVLEEQMDASFNALISKMEEQLTAEEIDSTAIIDQYRAEYQKIKEANRDALMEKAMAAVKN